MAETTAHQVGHVFPPLPVRQSVLSVPKRLRWYPEQEPQTISAVLRMRLHVIAVFLRQVSGADSPHSRCAAAAVCRRLISEDFRWQVDRQIGRRLAAAIVIARRVAAEGRQRAERQPQPGLVAREIVPRQRIEADHQVGLISAESFGSIARAISPTQVGVQTASRSS